jgi:hypothetical protein
MSGSGSLEMSGFLFRFTGVDSFGGQAGDFMHNQQSQTDSAPALRARNKPAS